MCVWFTSEKQNAKFSRPTCRDKHRNSLINKPLRAQLKKATRPEGTWDTELD